MKAIISQMSPGNSAAIVQAFDSSDLKEAIKRLTADVDLLKKQQFQTTADVTRMNSEVSATQKQAIATATDLSKLTIRVDRLEDLLSKLQRTLNDLQIRVAQLAGAPPPATSTHTATIISSPAAPPQPAPFDDSIIQDLL